MHPDIESAAKQYDEEKQTGTSRVAMASILWDDFTETYRRIKNIYINRANDYFDDIDLPFLTYGIDSNHSRHHNSLYHYLRAIDNFTQLNQLVDLYDSINSRQNHASTGVRMVGFTAY